MAQSTPTERLAGRVALITGGGGAIGAAVARAFDADGAVVIVADVRSRRPRLPSPNAARTSAATRRHLERRLERRRSPGRVARRQSRHTCERRRHPRAGAGREHGRRGLGPRGAHQYRLGVLRLPRGHPDHAPARFGIDHQHRHRPVRCRILERVHVVEVPRPRLLTEPRARGGALRDPRQLHRTGQHPQHRLRALVPREGQAAPGCTTTTFWQAHSTPSRCIASACPWTSRQERSTWSSDDASYVTGQLLNVDGGFSGYSIALAREEV